MPLRRSTKLEVCQFSALRKISNISLFLILPSKIRRMVCKHANREDRPELSMDSEKV